jgi:tRNA threonylcarbamoyladenosine biosynthesis protein TsaE
MKTCLTFRTDSPEATRQLAARLGAHLQAGDVVALYGDLGAGKTCFVQGLAAGMGIRDHVTSPTFILVRTHPGTPALCHADAYRLESPAELEDLGLEDLLAEAVLAIEWAEKVQEALPTDRLEVTLRILDDDARELTFCAGGERSEAVLREALA